MDEQEQCSFGHCVYWSLYYSVLCLQLLTWLTSNGQVQGVKVFEQSRNCVISDDLNGPSSLVWPIVPRARVPINMESAVSKVSMV